MIGSTYKDLLDPQIAARNRVMTKNATPAHDLPRRPRRSSASAVNTRSRSTRGELVAAVGVVLTALLAVFIVLVLQAGHAGAKPTPSTGYITVVNGHGGGGTSFRAE